MRMKMRYLIIRTVMKVRGRNFVSFLKPIVTLLSYQSFSSVLLTLIISQPSYQEILFVQIADSVQILAFSLLLKDLLNWVSI